MSQTFADMDRMYRPQRYIYDATRKFYLLGRDRLLQEMQIEPGDHVLEPGCGTARNLIRAARQNPDAHFYGLDASSAMLQTARAKVNAARVNNVTLRLALADDFSAGDTFDLDQPFDKIFFSFSISMIGAWRESIANALENLKPGGELFIVDFYDLADLPAVSQRLLLWWLSKFHVRYWPELLPHLGSIAAASKTSLTVTPLYRRYSFIAHVVKAV